MKPASFDYLRADTLDEALKALSSADEDDVRVIAGGQSLMAMLNMRLAQPKLLVDISAIEQLSVIRIDGDMLEVGATITQAELKSWSELPEVVPLLAKALPNVGHFQTRNRGTVCGSVAHADPSSEIPLCLATLEGEVMLQSAKGKRRLSASEFQTGMLSTAKRPDEMIVAVRFPVARPCESFAFREVARRHGDFAIVAIAARSTATSFRLGVGGVAGHPQIRDWDNVSDGQLDEYLNEFAWALDATDDIHATARYRRELVRRLGRVVYEELK